MQQQGLEPAPFVNAEYMARYMNRTVRLVGSLVDTQPGNVQLKSSDNQTVTVRTTGNTCAELCNSFVANIRDRWPLSFATTRRLACRSCKVLII
jgi:Replication factor A protein 3